AIIFDTRLRLLATSDAIDEMFEQWQAAFLHRFNGHEFLSFLTVNFYPDRRPESFVNHAIPEKPASAADKLPFAFPGSDRSSRAPVPVPDHWDIAPETH